jgi:Uma2 family endonuclease
MPRKAAVERSEGPDRETPLRMTYEEFLDWLDDEKHAEWVDGEVVWMSPISKQHQSLLSFLMVLLTLYLEARPLGTLLFEPFQMKTGPDLPGRAPDLLFVATENLHRLQPSYLNGPADIVVEIVSPDDPDRDRVMKLAEYERGGVREYWLLDQPRQEARFYERGEDGKYRLIPVGDDGVFRSGVLPGCWLEVAWLWQEPRPPILSILKEWGLV